MKQARHQMILELIEKQPIDKQEKLQEYLKAAGFLVTQATVSRDIRELQLVKSVDGNGVYRYSVSGRQEKQKRFEMIFGETVSEIDYSGNIVMVKCFTGMANAACELFDTENGEWSGVVGTLSGDNTFIVLMRTESDAGLLAEKLKKYVL